MLFLGVNKPNCRNNSKCAIAFKSSSQKVLAPIGLFSKMLAPHGLIFPGKDPVQICRGTDQREMGECLWEITEMLPA